MSADVSLVADTANRLFADAATPELLRAVEVGGLPTALWELVEEAGFTAALEPDSGVSLAEALAILRAAGVHAAPIPIAETMLARRLLAEACIAPPSGPLSIGLPAEGRELKLIEEGSGHVIDGVLVRVPFARDGAAFATLARGARGSMVVSVPVAEAIIDRKRNLAGEPRDDIRFEHAKVQSDAAAAAPAGIDAEWLLRMAALLRSAQLVGALERVLEMSVGYANERKQFGRPIGKFQAIQHQLAALGGEVAVSVAALDMAAQAVAGGSAQAGLAVAAAKARASEAAGIAAQIAHRVHGAIGFTREYGLQLLTRRLLSWRDDYGTEAYWNAEIGRAVLAPNAGPLWSGLSSL
ncbi:MAG: acyl-CoA dehydrogenase family protein [Alphaproteobacteria bacterium]